MQLKRDSDCNMATIEGPNIVRNGLIMWLDAGNVRSYPGSGTTWRDISGNGYTATLNNGPTFTSVANGSFLMDNINDTMTLNNINWNSLGSTRNFTFMFGSKKISYGTGGNNTGDSLIFLGAGNGYNSGWRITDYTFGTPGTAFNGAQSYAFQSPGITSTLVVSDTFSNRFAICAFAQNAGSVTGFLNGVVQTTGAFGAYSSAGNSGLVGFANAIGVGYFSGYISFFLIYNRALSLSEMQQNYNAYKGRFDL